MSKTERIYEVTLRVVERPDRFGKWHAGRATRKLIEGRVCGYFIGPWLRVGESIHIHRITRKEAHEQN